MKKTPLIQSINGVFGVAQKAVPLRSTKESVSEIKTRQFLASCVIFFLQGAETFYQNTSARQVKSPEEIALGLNLVYHKM